MPPYYNNEGIPFQPRREYYNGQVPLAPVEIGTDRIGDYVARRLVPIMLGRSERPLQLVMNFGDLTLEEAPSANVGGTARSGSSRSASNAVIYNAPGCTMTIANSDRARDRQFRDAGAWAILGSGDDGRVGAAVERRIGICLHCSRRQLVNTTGYCIDCDFAPDERLALEGGGYRGWDGIRYLQHSERNHPWTGPVGLERWQRSRYRERLPQIYYSDSDVSGRW